MKCRICHKNAVVSIPTRNVYETLLRPFLRFAYCSSCFTDLKVRGVLLLGPRIDVLRDDEDYSAASRNDKPASVNSTSLNVNTIAGKLRSDLSPSELDQLIELLAAKQPDRPLPR